jgi:hypothetical protein
MTGDQRPEVAAPILRSWNHRVIRHQEPDGDAYYEIHECHYDKRGDAIPRAWTESAVSVGSDTRAGLFWVLSVMTEAVGKPVLEIVGDKLREIEPSQELSDELKRALEYGKAFGLGEVER